MGKENMVIGQQQGEVDRLRVELADERRSSEERRRQLERYASDLRETFKSERARADELRESYFATVRALTNAVEARDAYTGKHAERVAAYGLEICRRVDIELADDPQTEFGFLLHDVGKVAIPDGILHKAAPLTDNERELMRTHAEIGFQIVNGVPFLHRAALIVRSHHERFDGSGYPDGLVAEEILLAARVFAVADALDAITTNRPYRRAAPLERARELIDGGAGAQFDPRVVDAFDGIEDAVLERIRTGIA